MEKIVQICAAATSEDMQLYALTQDGTVLSQGWEPTLGYYWINVPKDAPMFASWDEARKKAQSMREAK